MLFILQLWTIAGGEGVSSGAPLMGNSDAGHQGKGLMVSSQPCRSRTPQLSSGCNCVEGKAGQSPSIRPGGAGGPEELVGLVVTGWAYSVSTGDR